MASEGSLGAVLTQVADKVTRLLVQHVQLVRSELEGEARSLGRRGRIVGAAAARAAPFLVAGVVLISFAVAGVIALLLEPWLGRFAEPLVTLVIGLAETLVAARWLRGVIAAVNAEGTEGRAGPTPDEAPVLTKSSSGDRSERTLQTTSIVIEEKPYGSVG